NGGNAASSGTREAVAATAVAAGGIQNKQPPEHMSPLWTTPRPLFISGRKICALSLSEVMGHLSFLFMGLGYLETELLPLRVYAAAGICCSTAFQYYRPQPLWIPISWNAIFLVINGSMVCLLLKEDHDARRQDEEAAALYDEVW
ncbi:unnamed protein product, partial [Sphacelaria rigidula]